MKDLFFGNKKELDKRKAYSIRTKWNIWIWENIWPSFGRCKLALAVTLLSVPQCHHKVIFRGSKIIPSCSNSKITPMLTYVVWWFLFLYWPAYPSLKYSILLTSGSQPFMVPGPPTETLSTRGPLPLNKVNVDFVLTYLRSIILFASRPFLFGSDLDTAKRMLLRTSRRFLDFVLMVARWVCLSQYLNMAPGEGLYSWPPCEGLVAPQGATSPSWETLLLILENAFLSHVSYRCLANIFRYT